MTKRHHKCDDEHCSVHKALTDDVKKKLAKKPVKKSKPKTVKIQQDRWSTSIDSIREVIDVVKNEDSFVALQHCIKILEGIKKDHGY